MNPQQVNVALPRGLWQESLGARWVFSAPDVCAMSHISRVVSLRNPAGDVLPSVAVSRFQTQIARRELCPGWNLGLPTARMVAYDLRDNCPIEPPRWPGYDMGGERLAHDTGRAAIPCGRVGLPDRVLPRGGGDYGNEPMGASMTEMPSEDEMREFIRLHLITPSLGMREPPPIVVEQIMRAYFEQWAMMGAKVYADRWLEGHIRSMVTP